MKFFGSVYFAMVLIALTILFVITGTFIESWTGSHLYAAHFTYSSPVFGLLLWLYFVNILLATLTRLPFKKRHIPFIMTHIGLLMILLGVLSKTYFGIQGSAGITEGSGTNQIFLPHTYALLVEDLQKRHFVPLKKEMKIDNLLIKLLEWHPHCEQHFTRFIKKDFANIIGFPPIRVDSSALKTTHYMIYSKRRSPTSVIFPGHAALYFLQDIEQQEHLVAFNDEGERFDHSFTDQAFLIFDKGYGGYGAFAELPKHFPPIQLIAPLTRVIHPLKAHKQKEELRPYIRLLISEGSHSEVLVLRYDPFAVDFKWPILKGKYLIRFQSLEKTLPIHIRLQEARQINYPGTNQPYSYESDLIIDDERTTISMNEVYGKQGYRFYLANLVTPPMSAKRVQIVVNYDPTKYFLTYPGAIILGFGMFFLYLRRYYA